MSVFTSRHVGYRRSDVGATRSCVPAHGITGGEVDTIHKNVGFVASRSPMVGSAVRAR